MATMMVIFYRSQKARLQTVGDRVDGGVLRACTELNECLCTPSRDTRMFEGDGSDKGDGRKKKTRA